MINYCLIIFELKYELCLLVTSDYYCLITFDLRPNSGAPTRAAHARMGMPPMVHRWRGGAGNCLNLKIIHGLQLQQLIHLAEKPMEKPMEKTTPGKSWNWDFFKFERSSRRSIYESWNVRSPSE